jgi:hypothetical protein
MDNKEREMVVECKGGDGRVMRAQATSPVVCTNRISRAAHGYPGLPLRRCQLQSRGCRTFSIPTALSHIWPPHLRPSLRPAQVHWQNTTKYAPCPISDGRFSRRLETEPQLRANDLRVSLTRSTLPRQVCGPRISDRHARSCGFQPFQPHRFLHDRAGIINLRKYKANPQTLHHHWHPIATSRRRACLFACHNI